MVAARDPAPVAMSSYEELKRRVAMLKQVDREETAARKAVAAQENAEVARAKAAMLAKEKENDERLHAAKKALHAATERSQAMRKQYESEIKKLQQKLDVTTGKLAASEEKASRDAVAAETRRRDALAEVNARWEADVAEREARRREETTELARLLEEARAKSSDRTSELLVRATQAEEAATAARAYSAALRDELENLKASAANASAARDREREDAHRRARRQGARRGRTPREARGEAAGGAPRDVSGGGREGARDDRADEGRQRAAAVAARGFAGAGGRAVEGAQRPGRQAPQRGVSE